MKYIITSGGIEVKIDNVRNIINKSTGKLGSLFADELSKGNNKVIYLHTKSALIPKSKEITKIRVNNSGELLKELQKELNTTNITEKICVIHLMAINDYKFSGSIDTEKFFELIIQNKNNINNQKDLSQLLEKFFVKTDKLDSNNDQFFYLKKDLKIIDEIKKINPSVILVGFKLLSEVTEEELTKVALKLKHRAKCDIVVGNIKEEITKTQHIGYIYNDKNEMRKVKTKEEIVNQVLKSVREMINC